MNYITKTLRKKWKSLVAVVSSVAVFSCMIPNTFAQSSDYYIFVSTKGNDSATGSKEHPLATLGGAKNAVRSILSQITEGNIIVTFEPGRYEIDSTVVFDKYDSGNDRVKVTYRAEEAETVSFVGSKMIDTSDFEPVKDEKIRKRLIEGVRDRIGQLDLRKSGINSIVNFLRPPHYGEVGLPIYKLYLDDSEQMQSRFPNEGYVRTGKIINPGQNKLPGISVDTTAPPAIFQTNLERSLRWATAKDAIIEGFFKYDWGYDVLYLDTVNENKEVITKNSTTCLGMQSNMRYAVMNLMEEIDAPGEYYIDRDNLMLYYYPPYPLTSDMKMEISLMTEDLLNLSEVSNITFERLSFEKTRGNGMIVKDGENISVLGCKFSNIGKSALEAEGYDIEIRSNNFSYIGGDCITIDGGNRTLLIPSNNRVENNHIYRYSLIGKTYTNGIEIYGCGNIIEHNLIHNAPHQAIWFEGNDNKIRYNEINDALKSSADAGAIYAGRDHVSRGNEIGHNYIHNIDYTEYTYGRIDNAYAIENFGIYMDDNFSGTWIHHNVVSDVVTGMTCGNGKDLVINDNVFYNSLLPWKIGSDTTLNQDSWKRSVLPGGEIYNKAIKQPYRGKIWQSKYPELKNYYLTTPNLQYPKDNSIYENLAVQTDEFFMDGQIGNAMRESASKCENNNILKNQDVFKSIENQNFTVTDEAVLKNMQGLRDIDISNIGLYEDEYRTNIVLKDTSFKKISPKLDYDEIDNLSSFFCWEDFFGADRYRLRIAKDPEFNDVVYDEETRYNYCTVTGLEANCTRYYWDVTAYVNVRQMQGEYKADGGTYSFVTNRYENVDKVTFETLFTNAKQTLSEITEGVKPGEYAKGSKEAYENVIKKAERIKNKLHPYQKEIDSMNSEIEEANLALAAARNKGYKNIKDMLSSEWVSYAGSVSRNDNGITLKGAGVGAGVFSGNPEKYELLNFNMKADFSAGLVGLAARQTHPDIIIWNRTKDNETNEGYYVVIKSEQIELQRFVGSDSDAMIKVIPNTFFKSNEEYDVIFGAVDVDGGVRIILRSNGETVFDEIDSERPVYDSGAFSISNTSDTGYITVSAVNKLPIGNVFDTSGTYKQTKAEKLSSVIDKAKENLSDIVEGINPGEYEYGTKEEYQEAVNEALAITNPDDIDNDEFNAICQKLEVSGKKAKGRVIKGYKNFGDLLSGSWLNKSETLKTEGDSVTLSGNGTSAGNSETNPEAYELLNFNMELNLANGWAGLAARQTRPDDVIWSRTESGEGNDGYLVVIKPEQIELQRFIASNSDAMIKVIPNTFFKNNTSYNVVFGAVDTEDGVRIIMKCNGETVFDETDTEKPIYKKGCFAICNSSEKGFIKISKVLELPKGSVTE